MIEEKLVALLRAVSTQTYPAPAPPAAVAPFILYQRTSSTRPQDSFGSVGVVNITFQVDCYARSLKLTRQMANRVRRALDRYQDANTVIRLEQERDLSDMTSDPTLYRTNLQFCITHDEWFDDQEETGQVK